MESPSSKSGIENGRRRNLLQFRSRVRIQYSSEKWADTFVIRIAHDMEDKGRHPLRPMRLRLPTSTNSKEFGLSYYIKIDVEGNELSSISGLSQAVPFLSFEVNLPEFRNNTIRCIEHTKPSFSKGRDVQLV